MTFCSRGCKTPNGNTPNPPRLRLPVDVGALSLLRINVNYTYAYFGSYFDDRSNKTHLFLVEFVNLALAFGNKLGLGCFQ